MRVIGWQEDPDDAHVCRHNCEPKRKEKEARKQRPDLEERGGEENVVHGREAGWEAGEYKDAIAPWGVGEQWAIRHLKRP